jgi:tRNA-2-methylthio-N6-dimethylallyladenosine synthase
VGFPGETEEDFARTLAVVEEARFDHAFTFLFSPRPGTAAARMEDRMVDPGVAQERFERLLALQNRITESRSARWLGRRMEVLSEGQSKRDPAKATTRTRGGKVVHVPGVHPAGTFLDVDIVDTATHHLMGAPA